MREWGFMTDTTNKAIADCFPKATFYTSAIVASTAAEALVSLTEEVIDVVPVSYTHLTLPTNREV